MGSGTARRGLVEGSGRLGEESGRCTSVARSLWLATCRSGWSVGSKRPSASLSLVLLAARAVGRQASRLSQKEAESESWRAAAAAVVQPCGTHETEAARGRGGRGCGRALEAVPARAGVRWQFGRPGEALACTAVAGACALRVLLLLRRALPLLWSLLLLLLLLLLLCVAAAVVADRAEMEQTIGLPPCTVPEPDPLGRV